MATPLRSAATALALTFLYIATSDALNITKVLQADRRFQLFNQYLSETKIADDVNTRKDVTVLVAEDSSVSALLKLDLGLETVKNILSLHVLLDYYTVDLLRSLPNGTATTTTLYQTYGVADGQAGLMNVTDLKKGVVGFTSAATRGATGPDATLVDAVEAEEYNMSVVQISNLIVPASVAVKSGLPSSSNITDALNRGGCGVFAGLLNSTGVLKSYVDALQAGGLTVFAPLDEAMKKAVTKFEKLPLSEKVTLLEYHALPEYSPLATLRAMKGNITTMATDGAEHYSVEATTTGEAVDIRTGDSDTAVKTVLLDEQPLVIFSVDDVFQLEDIFVSSPSPAPAPAPSPATEKPKSPPAPPSDSPAEAPTNDIDSPGRDAKSNFGWKVSAGSSSAGMVTAMLLLAALGHM